MTNKTKIIIGLIIIVAIIIAIFGITRNKTKEETNKTNDEFSNMLEYINEISENDIEVNNTTVENEVEENIIQNTIVKNEVINNTTPQVDNDIIGKEEEESNNENTGIDNEKIAIDLAKQEWGISVESYDFQAELSSDGIYKVSVINKTDRTVITIYNVNIKTGTVTE